MTSKAVNVASLPPFVLWRCATATVPHCHLFGLNVASPHTCYDRCMLSKPVAPLLHQSCFAAHCCVGVVRSPCRGQMWGEPVWTCRLLLAECGRSAAPSPQTTAICSQEMLALKCRGLPFVEYSVNNLREGSLVHVVSKIYKKPRFVPIHGTYVEDTELVVTEQFGSLVLLGHL
ncbi:hypothetical protein, conserved [Trypanosoma brucei gambiense DAL972]|uniref:Uncharacterized protein n=1 Tax=Trypanosoma brucei gambiense (strain MHOM/CI/86/DAL972) TaxID=679716 RepID=D0A3R9_TRYB9|nr:hypothetical protein, conserved [Trypanosoma brucei gambiense DAL972]CBH15913.1 hypothetical protein, conserved [Trypanosoma brucei gambiense DAL972]|eukprot:XP_011778177.1 hypothetical protein, conserved [Trypanosoma brucei gambiense DAL972]